MRYQRRAVVLDDDEQPAAGAFVLRALFHASPALQLTAIFSSALSLIAFQSLSET